MNNKKDDFLVDEILENNLGEVVKEEIIVDTKPIENLVMEDEAIITTTEKPPVGYRDIQNSSNTTFFDETPYKSPIKKDEKPKTIAGESYSVFTVMTGLTNEKVEHLTKLLLAWEKYQTVKDEPKRYRQEYLALTENQFTTLAEEFFPGKTLEEVGEFCLNAYTFTTDFLDKTLFNSPKLEAKLENLIMRYTNQAGREIVPLIPGAKAIDTTVSNLIRRTRRRSTNNYENYDICLANSFVKIRIKRPNLEQLANFTQELDNNIRSTTRIYNGNSLMLSRAETYQNVLTLLKQLIVDTTIDGLTNYDDIDEHIRYTDMQAIMLGLTSAAEGDTFPITIACSNPNCGHVDVVNIDPTYMLHIEKNKFTEDQGAIYNNVCNRSVQYSHSEIEKVIADSKPFKRKIIYLEDKKSYFVLREPTLRTFFNTYEFFKDKTQSVITNLRTQPISEDEYKDRSQEVLALFKMIEFYQWVDEFYVWDATNQEGTSYTRKSIGDQEMNLALFDELSDNPSLTTELIKEVVEACRLMSFTIVGLNEYKCEKCGDLNGTGDKKENIIPIDMLMAFIYLVQARFIRTQKVEI